MKSLIDIHADVKARTPFRVKCTGHKDVPAGQYEVIELKYDGYLPGAFVLKSESKLSFEFDSIQGDVIWELISDPYIEPPPPPKCECGADTVGMGAHSFWCPKFQSFV